MVETKHYPATPKPVSAEVKAAAPKPQTPAEIEAAKTKAEAKKVEHAAHDTVGKVNTRLAKEGSTNRLQVQMRGDKPKYLWVNEVPTRELTPDEMAALDAMS
jgi:hypothetical protein